MSEGISWKLFGGESINNILESRANSVIDSINDLPECDFISSNFEKAVEKWISKGRLVPPTFAPHDPFVIRHGPCKIDLAKDPEGLVPNVFGPGLVEGQFLTLGIQLLGNASLLVYRPATCGFDANAGVRDQVIEFYYQEAPVIDVEKYSRLRREFEQKLHQAVESVQNSISAYHLDLERRVVARLQERRNMAESTQTVIKTLGLAKRPEPAKSNQPKLSIPTDDRTSISTIPFEYDVFISHAWEDKDSIATPLSHYLLENGCRVWIDEQVIEIGDSLVQKIDHGLIRSKFGIVILSPHFFSKNWPRYELDGLLTREQSGSDKVILPVWHNVGKEEVLRYSTSLAARMAGNSKDGIKHLADELLRIIKKT